MSSIGVRPATSGGHPRVRRRVTTWAALGVLALLATLLTPLSTASAQEAPAAPELAADASMTLGNKQITLKWTAPGVPNDNDYVYVWEYDQKVAGGSYDGIWDTMLTTNKLNNSSDTERTFDVTGLTPGSATSSRSALAPASTAALLW